MFTFTENYDLKKFFHSRRNHMQFCLPCTDPSNSFMYTKTAHIFFVTVKLLIQRSVLQQFEQQPKTFESVINENKMC